MVVAVAVDLGQYGCYARFRVAVSMKHILPCRRAVPVVVWLCALIVAPGAVAATDRAADQDIPAVIYETETRYGVLIPGLDVLVLPGLDSEFWPGNYVPNTYRLPDYSGQPAPPLICRGQTGMTVSTVGDQCPKGQRPAAAGNRISTTHPVR